MLTARKTADGGGLSASAHLPENHDAAGSLLRPRAREFRHEFPCVQSYLLTMDSNLGAGRRAGTSPCVKNQHYLQMNRREPSNEDRGTKTTTTKKRGKN